MRTFNAVLVAGLTVAAGLMTSSASAASGATTVEVEAFSTQPGGKALIDRKASGRSAVVVSRGRSAATKVVTQQPVVIHVRASAPACARGARLKVTVDGAAASALRVPRGGFKTLDTGVRLAPGRHRVTLTNAGDRPRGACARPLVLDAVTLVAEPAATTSRRPPREEWVLDEEVEAAATPTPTATPVATPAPAATPARTFSSVLGSDMTQGSETMPHGVTYPWASKPRLSLGNTPPPDWKSMTAWGQLYECASGNPQPTARVEVRDMKAWVRAKTTNQWTQVQTSATVEGAAYVENYAGNVNKPANTYITSGGGTSATAGGGYNFHFWPKGGRANITATNISGVIVTVRARLEPGTFLAAGASPCFVLSAGGDYWSTAAADWSNFATNNELGIGRFKRVDASWRIFTLHSIPALGSSALPDPKVASAAEFR